MAATSKVSGRVTRRGVPVAGASLRLFDLADVAPLATRRCPQEPKLPLNDYACPQRLAELSDLAARLLSGRIRSRAALTDASGDFEISTETGHRYRLWASSDVGVAAEVVSSGERLNVRLQAGIPLKGLVEDRDGPPVAGAAVTVLAETGDRVFALRTDIHGIFEVPRVPDVGYVTLCEHPGFVPHIETGVCQLSRPHRISGVVEGMQSGVPAFVTPGPLQLPTRVGADGRFSIDALEWGTYQLVARQGERVATASVDLTQRSVAEVRLRLEMPAEVEGIVTDSITGQAIPGATIHISSPSATSAIATDSSGHFLARLAPGESTVDPEAPFYRRLVEPRQVTAKSGEHLGMDFALKPAVPFRGRLVDSSGEPFPDAGVSLIVLDVPDEPPQTSDVLRSFGAVTDEHGAFLISEAGAGQYLLDVEPPLLDVSPRTIALPSPPVTLTGTSQREGAGQVSGVVVDTLGKPIVNASLEAKLPNDFVSSTARTDVDGEFTVTKIPDGEWEFAASAYGDEQRQTVKVTIGKAPALHFVLDPGAPLSGRVLDDRGQPVPGAVVEAWEWTDGKEAERSTAYARSDALGSFTLMHIHGRVHLIATAESFERAPRAEPIMARAGDSDVILKLRRVAQVAGRVLGPDGAPVSSFAINGETMEAPEGRFTIAQDRISKGVIVTTPDHEILFLPPPGEMTDSLGDLVLPEGPPLTGRILDADTGEPVPGVLVTSPDTPDTGGAWLSDRPWETRSGPDGSFRFGPVLPPPTALELRRIGYGTVRIPTRRSASIGDVRLRRVDTRGGSSDGRAP